MENYIYDHDGLQLTEAGEGLRLTAYQDSGGVWTIAYGHTGPDVHPGMTLTPQQAEILLQADLKHACATVNAALTRRITQHQFDALVDFCFNVGSAAFLKSHLLECVNQGNDSAAEDEFLRWVNAGGRRVAGLVRRRTMEVAMYKAA